MTSLTYIGADQATSTNPREGRVIGIQTRIAEHLLNQGGLSSPFPSEPIHCAFRHPGYGPCIREHGHTGCHAFKQKNISPKGGGSYATAAEKARQRDGSDPHCASPAHVQQARAALSKP